MKTKITRLLTFIIAIAVVAAILPSASAADSPYYIKVNREACTVTVYGKDDSGNYSVPVRAMICSVGREGHRTPLGTYKTTSNRKEWCYMVDGSYGQYSVQFNGNILFHSVCYRRADPATLMTYEYNDLGGPASLGCVRLQVEDAKWVYDNCPAGTKVTVYEDSDPGPLGKPAKRVDYITPEMDNGWEPTDPRPENPWSAFFVNSLYIDSHEISLTAGDSKQLQAYVDAYGFAPKITWSSDMPSVATVTASGKVVAHSAGVAWIIARCGAIEDVCTVTVTGELLPFDDAEAGAWYYEDLRYVNERGIMIGTGYRTFSPSGTVSFAQAVQTMYNLENARTYEEPTAAGDKPWYSDALAWAHEIGITDGMEALMRDPNQVMERQTLMVLLYRYEALKNGASYVEPTYSDTLAAFSDAGAVTDFARESVCWAIERGLLRGTGGGKLSAETSLTRAQWAAILHRWLE
ncbi:MAG: L,D-transpeptidase family protein [Oscillospiraceae bacterium]|nr:L,D-transpeptidase family protein [Oscillospiraceae bacterium]